MKLLGREQPTNLAKSSRGLGSESPEARYYSGSNKIRYLSTINAMIPELGKALVQQLLERYFSLVFAPSPFSGCHNLSD